MDPDALLQPEWRPAPGLLELASGDVHLWRIDLAQEAASPEWSSLSHAERQRAERYRFDRHRRRFVAGRANLRRILSRYVGEAPGKLVLSANEAGKPILSSQGRTSPVHFNLSHSSDLAICAVRLDAEIGVDVEHIRPNVSDDAIVQRFFSHREARAFNELPNGARERAFFVHWTCKEAYCKALGDGLRLPLDQFEILFDHSGIPVAIASDDDPSLSEHWALHAFTPAPGAMAAVVAEKPCRAHCYWEAE